MNVHQYNTLLVQTCQHLLFKVMLNPLKIWRRLGLQKFSRCCKVALRKFIEITKHFSAKNFQSKIMFPEKAKNLDSIFGINISNRCFCRCCLLGFLAFFVAFWIFIIFFASAPDKTLDISVNENYKLPQVNPRYNSQINSRIPLVFHRTWKSGEIPEKWREIHQHCLDINQDFDVIIWTDEMIYNFIKQNYPWFYSIFIDYPYHIQRVDVARYFLLYHFGGVYLDMDAQCITPFKDLLHDMEPTETVLMPMTDIYGVTNSFMASAPKSKYFEYVIYELPKYAHGVHTLVRHTTIILSTGPTFLSRCLDRFEPKSEIHVMSLSDYENVHFRHAKGGTWHGVDTEIVDLFHFHYFKLLFLGLFCVFCAVLIKYFWMKRRSNMKL